MYSILYILYTVVYSSVYLLLKDKKRIDSAQDERMNVQRMRSHLDETKTER